MKKFDKKDEFKFYVWIGAIWLFLWLFSTSLNYSDSFIPQFLNELWRVLYFVVVNFLFFEYFLPLILRKRPKVLYTILVGTVLISFQLILISFGLFVWKSIGILLGIYTSFRQVTLDPGGTFNIILEDVFFQAQSGVASLLFFGIPKLFYDNFKLKQTAQLLRIEKQAAELNYLKSQTNPHFLFNTLNNIYSLSMDKSDLAPESILRLSKILRFMLQETNGKFITVKQELDIISDYVALEQMRYDDSLKINFNLDIDNPTQPIAPLLMIPLVENAFKHGVSETDSKPFIDIDLSINKHQLFFSVRNSTEKSQGGEKVKENIGLTNIRRQLELLYKDYNLTVQQDDTTFTSALRINLESHV